MPQLPSRAAAHTSTFSTEAQENAPRPRVGRSAFSTLTLRVAPTLPPNAPMPLSEEQRRSCLEIGVVGKPHGIRGEVKVRLHNAASDALTRVARVLLSGDAVSGSYEIARMRQTPGGPILQLGGVEGRDQAETLRGARVLVERSDLPPLAPGDYYLVDLIGCRVTLQGSTLGTAVAVRPDPTVDTLVIELSAGGTAEQPILDPWILRVDVAERTVELASDDGLIV